MILVAFFGKIDYLCRWKHEQRVREFKSSRVQTNKNMKKAIITQILLAAFWLSCLTVSAQERRPIDPQHPLWFIHIDVWYKADPQKIIDLIPDDIKPYVCMNLSLSCQYDTEKNVYKMPQNAVRTYKSWGSVCQANGMWFTCQPASGGHTHIQDDDLETFEYFYKHYPNFLGWNYAEQFWGFDEANDKSSSSQTSRIALFAKLVPMAHQYGGFLTISFCGNIWSHLLNPVGMMKRNSALYKACKQYPEAILWLYKYTTSSCFYNNESVTFSPFVSGLAKNYGVRYDNCGWNGALDALLGDNHGKKYPNAAGIGTVMEQTCVNGGAVWDGPELTWTEDIHEVSTSSVDGYTRRNWSTFDAFRNVWIDMFRKIIDGTLYIPTREEVVDKTKIIIINNVSSGSDEDKYAAWGSLYDGLYKQTDPFNTGNGQWMNNYCYFKSTGRYGAIPVTIGLNDDLAKSIPVQVNKSAYSTRWSTQTKKVAEFNKYYPEISSGDLYVSRLRNQLITYTPYTYLNKKTTASALIPLLYNTCDTLSLTWGKLSSGSVREYADHIDFYLNNYRSDTTTVVTDLITVKGVTSQPSYTFTKRVQAKGSVTAEWDEEAHTYTLTVRHHGPVDLTVNCQGTGTDRLTDYLPSESLSADIPKQPDDYNGEIIIEAEDMDRKSTKSCVLDPYGAYPSVRGHSGNGFMDMGTSTSGAIKHVLNVKHPGDYKIAIRYSNASKAGTLAASVNGKRQALKFTKTATNQWLKVTFDATLNEGDNTLIVTNVGGVGIYIDNVTYTPAELPAERFAITLRQADHGTVVLSTDSATEGETIVLDVTPDEGYQLTGWNVTHGGITVADDNTFIMPDDNVTLAPVFKNVTAVYTLDFTDVLSGTLPPGWRAVQENSTIHQYPDSYSSGARTFVGFTGYQGKGLYWREECAEYGRQTAYKLSLEPRWYRLTFVTAAWKSTPKFCAQIMTTGGDVIAQSDTYTARPNANGNTSANLSTATEYTLDFEIPSKGNYIIRFTNMTADTGGLDEFLLLECRVNTTSDPTGIDAVNEIDLARNGSVFDLSGRRIALPEGTTLNPSGNGLNGSLPKGIYIIDGRKVLVK